MLKNKVLIVDDEPAQRLLLSMTLQSEGSETVEAENGVEALSILKRDPSIRIVITDLNMPEMNGLELIEHIRNNDIHYTYIIVLTSLDDRDSLLKALTLGADDYLSKPVFPRELVLRLRSAERMLMLEIHEGLVFSMAKLSEYRSAETGYHLERVRSYTELLGCFLADNVKKYNITRAMAMEIARLSPLHDIGKIAIGEAILHKPGKLTDEEFEIIKTHVTIGAKIIEDISAHVDTSFLKIAHDIVFSHHEKWDGSGYPSGLTGEDIPTGARLVALADVYDALTSKRCYKDKFSHEKARGIIVEGSGRHFDPSIVDAFLHLENEFIAIREKFDDRYALGNQDV